MDGRGDFGCLELQYCEIAMGSVTTTMGMESGKIVQDTLWSIIVRQSSMEWESKLMYNHLTIYCSVPRSNICLIHIMVICDPLQL